MKFSCNQQQLSKALNIVSKAVTSRTTIPILKGILLTVDDKGILKMSASDLDLTIEKNVVIGDGEEGSLVVAAKLFGDIIRKLPNETITVEENEGNVLIKCSNSEFNIVGLSAEEFPNIRIKENDDEEILFEKETLKEMIRKTNFAASIDEARGVITGVLIEIKENNFNMVSLDGFRMAISREKFDNDKRKEIIIPAKTLNEVNKIISETEEIENKVKIIINEKKAVFIMDDIKVDLRLLEGEFVNYRGILPKTNKTKIVLNKNDFLNSIERASLLAKVGKNNLVKLEIGDNNIEITSKSEEGNVKENVIASREGEGLTIGFNSKYLIDILKVIDDEQIVMYFDTSISPCLIKPIEGKKFEYLILPVRITNN